MDGLPRNSIVLLCVGFLCWETCCRALPDEEHVMHPGHVSKTDRKYLTKGGFYRGARHYWPFDYETQLRDVKYSRDGRQKGTSTGVSIAGKGRGYLSISGNGWVRLGKFLKECVCDVHHCASNGVSIGLWVKLPNSDNETKVLVGSDKSGISNATGIVIYQSSRGMNDSELKRRYITTAVFMNEKMWKCHFAVEAGHWFYLTVTWSSRLGLLMFKDGELVSEQKRPKSRPRKLRYWGVKCAVTLSPPSASGTTLNAFYDDLVIWTYELNRTLIDRVYRNAIDPPKIEDCKTSDGVSAEIYINDMDHIYDIKGDYKISWQRKGGTDKGENFTKDLSYHIKGLVRSSEYMVEVQRRVFLGQTSETVLSKSSRIICNTQLDVPTRPKAFTVREIATEYFNLQWKPPDNVYGSTYIGYKISYRVDDFLRRKWSFTFRADVNSTYLTKLRAFTDYVIKLACHNENGIGKAVMLRATTAEGVPTPPRRLRVKLKREIIVIKWREPKEMKGLVDYRLFALINGTLKIICNPCGESYRLEDVDQNTKYTFWVIAYNINNDPRFESKPSEKQNITTPSFTPSSPNNLVVNFTQSGIKARWETSTEPRGRIKYKLLGLVNGSKHETFCDECDQEYLIEDVAKYTVYTLWAIAYNVHKDYESPPSLKVTIDTSLYVPTMPGSLTVNPSSEGIVISWNKSQVHQGSIRYQLIGRKNGVNKVFCVDCGLKYSINKTEENMNYSFWVVASNIQSGYQSLPSSIVHYHTAGVAPPPPEYILAPEVTESSASITWSVPRGVDPKEIVGYKVILYDAFSIVDIQTTDSLQHKFSSLTQFSKFYVTVQALTRSGYSLPSQLLTIHTKDKDECAMNDVPCSKNARCINSAGSYFCSCTSGYVGDGNVCEALPFGITEADFCPEEEERNITWKETYNGQTDKNLCPSGTIGISTRTCLTRNGSKSYWSDPDLSNCVSDWMAAVDDMLADRTLNGTVVGEFFLNLLDENDERGLYGGDIIKSVDVIDKLYNKSKNNELDQQKSNHKVAETLLMNLINITEKIISPETIEVWNDIPKNGRTEQSIRIMNGLDSAVLKSAKIVNFSAIESEYVDVHYGRVSTFKLRNNMSSSEEHLNEIDSVKLPEQDEKGNKVEDQSVAVIKYDTIAEVLSVGDKELNDKDVVNSAVLSISMNPPLSTPFHKPLEFKLSNQKDGKFEKHKCAFLNTSRYPGLWSTSGCVVFNVTNKFTVCHCYHMTSFSVLMQVKPAEISYSDELILDWITRIGLCISLAALGLAFLTFVFLPRPCGHRSGSRCFKLCDQGYRPTYLKKVRTSIHANLILSLALGEALFLWGIDKTGNKTTCYTVAVALHYLFLVAFHWMAAEGVILYLVLVKVFQRKSANKDKRMFMIICWGAPAAIVCIALVVGHEYYLHEKCCWLSVTHGMIWGFIGPALAIILLNIFFLCCTFHVMGRRQRWDKTDKNMTDKIRYWAKGAAIITCLLGVTWVFGVFYLNSDSVIVAYIFNICNVFQGLFIFVFHCLLDEKIRQQYYQVLCAVGNVDSRSPSVSTGTGKKEQRRGTFNSWLWSVAPMKLQDSKSESCPTVGENTLKRLNSSTHSLSPHIDRRLMEIKQCSETRPRGMSSIYHDSDENMDNIPDNILTVKHGSKNNSGKLYYQDENTAEGVFEEHWMSAISRGNSQEFLEVPQETCEDCLYEIKQWEEQQEISIKTNSLHEQDFKKLEEPCCRSLESKNGYSDYDETNIDKELCQESTTCTDNEDQHEKLLTSESEKDTEQPEQCKSYTSIVPNIILLDVSKSKNATTLKCYEMVKVTDAHGVEISSASGKELPCPMSV